jgi:hypothetical protein
MLIRATATFVFRPLLLALAAGAVVLLANGEGLALAPGRASAAPPAQGDHQAVGEAATRRGRTCQPGEGWRWTAGPARPEVAAQVQQALLERQLDVMVEATSFGEVDSCGTFVPFEVDFRVELRQVASWSEADRQRLADDLYPVLQAWAQPALGTTTLALSNGAVQFLSDPQRAGRLEAQSFSTGWLPANPALSPSGRYLHGLAYDSDRRVTVLFGGDNTGTARLSDTWQFDGTNWSQLAPAQSPPGRANIDQTLVYDTWRRRTILFGGLGASGYLSDTWEFDGTAWMPASLAFSPAPRDAHAMAFDTHRGVALLFGGYGSLGTRFADTWQYDGAWQSVSTGLAPSGRLHHSMAYDAQRRVTVLFGGSGGGNTLLGDTWEYDGSAWHQVFPAQSPPARENHALAYDNNRGVVVLFGGETASGPRNDTWEYDGTTWRRVASLQSPWPRGEMSMVYDQDRGRLFQFGGGYWNGSFLNTFNDTWEYVGPGMIPPGALNKKVLVIVYDPLLANGELLSERLHWNDHAALTQGTIDLFRQASNNRVQYSVVDTLVVTDGWPAKIDGFRYTEAEYLSVIAGTSPSHQPDGVDYTLIANSPQFDICGRANRGEIDEVWIYNGPAFGFYESTLVGPGAYWYNSPPVPGPTGCNRVVPIMGPSPERGLDSAVHNFGHRTESTLRQVYGSWEQNRTDHSWERFALVKALSPNYAYSGCGNVHFPPNATSDYDYANPATVMSNCEDFAHYPSLSDPATVLQPVTGSHWDNDQVEYLRYWFQHLPRNTGCGPDNVANNWWRYFAEPVLALNPPAGCASVPLLHINYSAGQPGSFFSVMGFDFPPNSPVTLTINGFVLTLPLNTDSSGSLAIVLSTTGADAGRYFVTATVNPSVTTAFVLDPDLPHRPYPGEGALAAVPAGIGFDEFVLLPMLQR